MDTEVAVEIREPAGEVQGGADAVLQAAEEAVSNIAVDIVSCR